MQTLNHPCLEAAYQRDFGYRHALTIADRLIQPKPLSGHTVNGLGV